MFSSSYKSFWEKLVNQKDLVCRWINCSVVSTSVLWRDKTEYEHKLITLQFIQISLVFNHVISTASTKLAKSENPVALLALANICVSNVQLLDVPCLRVSKS